MNTHTRTTLTNSLTIQVADLYTDMTSSKQTASAAFTAAANAELRFLGGAPEDLSFNSEVNSNDAWAQSGMDNNLCVVQVDFLNFVGIFELVFLANKKNSDRNSRPN